MFLASVLTEHLSSPEYMHFLLNPLPVYGLAVGVFGLSLSLCFRAREPRDLLRSHLCLSAPSRRGREFRFEPAPESHD